MTRKFASIELARLYEAQGYLKDALSMYKDLDDDILEGGGEVRAAVKRLELALLKADEEDPPEQILLTLEELTAEGESEPRIPEPPIREKEEKMTELMEKWLALMVVRKRLKLFKRIRARV